MTYFEEQAKEALEAANLYPDNERVEAVSSALIKAYKRGWAEATETVWKEHALGHTLEHAVATLKAVRKHRGEL